MSFLTSANVLYRLLISTEGPRLAGLLVKPGDADKYGRDLASLPYQLLVRAYGDRAVTYLERAVSESPYAFVRTQSAEELALRGRPIAYRFFYTHSRIMGFTNRNSSAGLKHAS
jgi:hypothetical protein